MTLLYPSSFALLLLPVVNVKTNTDTYRTTIKATLKYAIFVLFSKILGSCCECAHDKNNSVYRKISTHVHENPDETIKDSYIFLHMWFIWIFINLSLFILLADCWDDKFEDVLLITFDVTIPAVKLFKQSTVQTNKQLQICSTK